MKWLYRGLMAVAGIGGSLVTAGILPVAYAVVFTAVGGAAAFFHESPAQTASKP
jgi:hypothetical protein